MKTRAILAIAAAAVLPACGIGIMAGADYARGLDLSPYRTFEWDEPDDRPVGDPRLENNPFFEGRLHAAIAVELADRGIRAGGTGRTLTVHHHATVRPRVDVYAADEQAGYSGTDYGEGAQVLQYDEGTILVDIADAETKDVLWRGWAQFDISRALNNPDVMERAIDEAIAKMFDDFPEVAR